MRIFGFLAYSVKEGPVRPVERRKEKEYLGYVFWSRVAPGSQKQGLAGLRKGIRIVPWITGRVSGPGGGGGRPRAWIILEWPPENLVAGLSEGKAG